MQNAMTDVPDGVLMVVELELPASWELSLSGDEPITDEMTATFEKYGVKASEFVCTTEDHGFRWKHDAGNYGTDVFTFVFHQFVRFISPTLIH